MNTHNLINAIHYRIRIFGWQALLGLILLIACILFNIAVVIPKSHQLEQLKFRKSQLSATASEHAKTLEDASPQALLRTFYHFLPPESDAVKLLSQVYKVATDYDVTAEKVDYHLTRNPTAQFSSYQVSLPLRGSYVEIRQFVNTLMNTLPSMSIDELSFHREDIHSNQVEANLRFSLILSRYP